MKSKLTLRLDEKTIKRAKEYARKKGISVSRLVSDYFSIVGKEHLEDELHVPPITSSLTGIIKNKKISEQDYKDHLEKKYLE